MCLPESHPSVGNRFYPKQLSEALWNRHVLVLVVPPSCHSLPACSMFCSRLERHAEKRNDCGNQFGDLHRSFKKEKNVNGLRSAEKRHFHMEKYSEVVCVHAACHVVTIWCCHTADIIPRMSYSTIFTMFLSSI